MELYLKIICVVYSCYIGISLVCFVLKKTKGNLLQRISMSHELPIKKAITVLLVALFALNCIDAVSTWYALSCTPAQEQNGIMGWLIAQGWFWFFLFKLGMAGGITIELYFLYVKEVNLFRPKKTQKKKYAVESIAVVCLFVGLYLWVCLHNISVIIKGLTVNITAWYN